MIVHLKKTKFISESLTMTNLSHLELNWGVCLKEIEHKIDH